MKKLLLTAFLAVLCLAVKAQNLNDPKYTYEFSGKPYEFEGVVKTDSTITKSQLYNKAVEWFAITFKDSKAVLQVQDKDAGLIIGKGVYTWNYQTYIGYVNFTIKLNFKDGRFKYELSDFITDGYGTIKDGVITKYPKMMFMGAKLKKISDEQLATLQKQTVNEATNITASLTDKLTKVKNENW